MKSWQPPKFTRKNQAVSLGIAFLLLLGVIFYFFDSNESQAKTIQPVQKKPTISNDGLKITFPVNSPGLKQLKISTLVKSSSFSAIDSPAEVVAIASNKDRSTDPVILFESSNTTSLFSQYRQSQSNLARSLKNFLRVKDMFLNQAATGRDLNEAEGELANAKAAKTEFEVRLRAIGFDPVELENAHRNTVWLFAHVSEAQLQEVEKGEDVKIYFSSFPGMVFSGKAEAIGDVVDPDLRTIQVRVAIQDPKGILLPGMFARCDFGQSKTAALIIPNTALITVEGQNYVFVAKSNYEFERKPVTVISSNTQESIALNGLQEGDRIVTSGAMLLKGLSFGY